jgi:hypothetical protein
MLKDWLGLHDINTWDWHAIVTVKDWWVQVVHKGATEKSHGFIHNVGLMGTMKEKNTRVF